LEYLPTLSLCQDDGINMEKKKILLRLDPKLHAALKQWADEEFRSLNSHIEFLLKKTLSSHRRAEVDE
tara:strand:- start:193 stop:396 length:204 start_codon:yes stop_codon:yes gene_type:complete